VFTITVYINTVPVITRSCRNTGKTRGGLTIYHCDDGREILHDPNDGAAMLAIKILEGVKDP
jgi:hypothetical protein